MNTLFIENDLNFTAEMLLGAMIDMGASVSYIENKLESSGIDAKIYHDTVIRNGMEAEFAYVKCGKECENIIIDDEIKSISSGTFDFNNKTTEQTALILAVLYAVICFLPDCIVCRGDYGKQALDRQIIKNLSNEQSDFVSGEVVCVGYGAGEEDILRCVIYSDGNGIELEYEQKSLSFII